MSDVIDAILQLRPALRLILFSLLLAVAVAALVATRWKNLPRIRSFALLSTFAVLFAAPLLTMFFYAADIGWRMPPSTEASEQEPLPTPFPMPLFDSLNGNTTVSGIAYESSIAAAAPAPSARFPYAVEWFIELWLIVTLLLLLSLPFGFLRLKQILTQTRAPNAGEQERLNRLQPIQNRQPAIRISPLDVVPFFTGLLRTRIVIPQRLLRDYSDDELRMVIEHEQAHARHRDQWVALLQQLTLALHWWNPMVWKLSRQLTVSREMLCDQAVTHARPGDFIERYRELLVTLTETLSHRAPRACAFALAATSCFKNLRERLVLLNDSSQKTDRRPSRLLVGTAALLAFSTLMISSCDNSPKQPIEEIELSEIDLMIQNGEITFDSFFSELAEPGVDPTMATPGRDVFIKSRFFEDIEQSSASVAAPAVKVERSSNDPQIYITTKFVETENKIDKNLSAYAILTDPQLQLLMRMLNMERGADLLSAPSVMTRNTETAKVEVIRRLPLPASPAFDLNAPEETTDSFVDTGVIVEITPTIKHGQIYLVGKAIVRTPDSPAPEPETPSIQGVLSFNTVETYFSAPVEDGSTLLINCRQDHRQNGSLLIALTAKAKDETGNDRKLK